MTEFLLIRHGESQANTNPDLIGGRATATPLTEQGRWQAAQVGEYLKNLPAPEAFFSSGAARTNETAAIALNQAGIDRPLHSDDRLLEMSLGHYEGTPRDDVYTPERIAQYNINSLTGKFPGTESIHDVQERMMEFMHEKANEYPDGRVYIFGHGFAIKALVGRMNDLDKTAIRQLVTNNVSLTLIEMNTDSHTVHYVGKNVIPEYT